ncbi:YggS family pyridoxal phosphate-dependent enzyme [Indioceanicola profundi]|uniref:YggS family pyridoxal phosphate-dependent enzyme n=1 Tax=Indioceanicola profundi TaxID=2220096 RepID=UPI000E6ADDAF|nr:YggS family pyridoxal phosphate-dependent enzyme [Indioceanicola profundi]
MPRATKPPPAPVHPTDDIAANLAAVRKVIADAAQAADRDPRAVKLVAVSKVQPMEKLRAALAAGQRVFGENRVQEAKSKFPDLRRDYPDIELHLIGPLQTNKVKDAVALFDVIQTVDRPKLAQALAAECRKQNRWPKFYVEVNTGEEPQKAGIAPSEVGAFLAACKADYGLQVAGLMCIPPAEEEPSMHFALLADLAKRHFVPGLSMGMSSDFDVAVRLGATMVRVGTGIFGERAVRDPSADEG